MAEYSYFRFSIENEKYFLYRKMGAILLLINGLAFLYLSGADLLPFTKLLFIFLGVILLLYAMYAFFSKSRERSYIILYLVCAFAWISEMGYFSPAVLLTVLMTLQIMAQTRVAVELDKYGVRIRSFRDRFFIWENIKHAVMKDGIMTIDLINNKIFQLEADLKQDIKVQEGGSLNHRDYILGDDYSTLESEVNRMIKKFKT